MRKQILLAITLISCWILFSSFLTGNQSTVRGGNGLEGDLHLLQMIGIGSLVAGMIVYQFGKMREFDLLLHLGKALILASVILNFMPVIQGEPSQKSMMVAIIFGLTGVILSAVVFIQFRNSDEDDDQSY